VTLPDSDHVARTCKWGSLDPIARSPTPASFEFRLDDKAVTWVDVYLSVNWMEYVQPSEGDLAAKVARLRQFQLANRDSLPLIKPTEKTVYAVVPVEAIHAATLESVGTTLHCRHEPQGDGDPHSGVHPIPGVEGWPASRDASAHLAIQQFMFQAICHWERGVLPVGPTQR
jgi:hypothetical protein